MAPPIKLTVDRLSGSTIPKNPYGNPLKIKAIKSDSHSGSNVADNVLKADSSYYQSSGSKPHRIYFSFRSKRLPLYLAMKTQSSFGSYHPKDIQLVLKSNTKEVKRYSCECSQISGWQVVKIPPTKSASCDQLVFEIHSNHSGGHDSKVEEIRIFGAGNVCRVGPQRELLVASLRHLSSLLLEDTDKKEEEEEEKDVKPTGMTRLLEACPFDIEISCKDGVVKAHSIILCSFSGFFRHLMDARKLIGSDGKDDMISFPDISSHILRTVISYLYTRDSEALALSVRGASPEKSMENLRDMYLLSRRLDIPSLDSILEDMLQPMIIEKTDSGAMDWACTHGSARLLKLAGLSILDNVAALNASGALEKLPASILKGVVEGAMLDFEFSSVSGGRKLKEAPIVPVISSPSDSTYTDWVIYPDETTVKVGHVVRIKTSISSPSYGWGSVNHSNFGIIASVNGDRCTINFSSQSGWSGKSSECDVYGPPGVGKGVVGGIPPVVSMCEFVNNNEKVGFIKDPAGEEKKDSSYSYFEL
ncbi:hypothetical protein ADUPG1_011203 [Aduncisulcus paluster]|uniref:BTB domain-containing protein n=1 Tax=Aduncisulcus paluster TaxID=2918883 RepID=A0ABQ5JUR5_9EUKA|nr:hypothetical protein ADUPG1_011203 [Aduncisulcus paluster]